MVAALGCCATVASAQTVHWTTNFYSVTGANFREIRQSIASARPWPDPFDGDTRWTISWRFSVVPAGADCRVSGFSTATRITTTLPRWTPPTNADIELKQQWTRYFTNLAQHEAGHAHIGLAAAAEVRQRIGEMTVPSGCDQLNNVVNERANKVVENYRAREKEYDRRTDHGRNAIDRPQPRL